MNQRVLHGTPTLPEELAAMDSAIAEMAAVHKREWEEAKSDIEHIILTLDHDVMPDLDMMAQFIANWNMVQGFWSSNNDGEKFFLIVTELAEGFEALRNAAKTEGVIPPSEHIPEYNAVEEEMADVLIRLLDYSGHHHIRLMGALAAKLRYNLTRPYKHGKTC